MPFVKEIKNKAYFKRFQTKYRRRREGKTDYARRRRLIIQDKNKYNSPKYRLVVRFTNKDVICQIVYAKIVGDVTLAAAYSHELPRYGMPVSLTSYAAAYATGLLVARRVLTKLGLADQYVGNVDNVGEDFTVEHQEGRRPFFALLDVGLQRTSTGAKVFAALKGALDGGIEIPHGESRFVGYDSESKKLNAETLRSYIFGGHVAEYMKKMKEENPDKYEKHFSQFIKHNITADNVEATWAKVHKAIRADPAHKSTRKPAPKVQKNYKQQKRSLAQRKDRIRQILAAKARKQQAE